MIYVGEKQTCKTEGHTRFSYIFSFVSYHKNMTLGQKSTTSHFSLNFIFWWWLGNREKVFLGIR